MGFYKDLVMEARRLHDKGDHVSAINLIKDGYLEPTESDTEIAIQRMVEKAIEYASMRNKKELQIEALELQNNKLAKFSNII
ncbi:hypothetical protein LQX96_004635 [Salmonella enterica]|nr:hypothetical protein [Salmonella enterica]